MPETPPLPDVRLEQIPQRAIKRGQIDWHVYIPEAVDDIQYLLAELTRLRAELAHLRALPITALLDHAARSHAEAAEAALTEAQHRALAAEQERDALHAALEWLVHLHEGVGKSGDTPSSDEWKSAIQSGHAALASAPPAAQGE